MISLSVILRGEFFFWIEWGFLFWVEFWEFLLRRWQLDGVFDMGVVDNFFNLLVWVSLPFLNELLLKFFDFFDFIFVFLLNFILIFFELIENNCISFFVLGNVLDGLVIKIYLNLSLFFECKLLLIVPCVYLFYW